MTERQLQFRVGLMVLGAFSVMAVMIFQFGELGGAFSEKYSVQVHFDSAPGVLQGSPVRLNGIPIGKVEKLLIDRERGGVLLELSIDAEYELRSDSVAMLQQSLLGDASIEFTAGVSTTALDTNQPIDGQPAFDLTSLAQRLEVQLATTMTSFDATSREWRKVAANVNSIVERNEGSLHDVVARTASSLQEFTKTMQRAGQTFDHANSVLGDRQTVENLRKALAGLPTLVNETQQTISAMRKTVGVVNNNLQNIEDVTRPLAQHTTSIVTRLDRSLANMEVLTKELRLIANAATKSDGSFQKLMTDPSLYRNLERSSAALAILLQNLDPVVRDMKVFADKVARRPELIGVGGVINPSSGLKAEEEEEGTGVRRTGFERTPNRP